MKIYNYDKISFEFIFESDAKLSPLESDVFRIPAFATDIATPVMVENESCTFDEISNEWNVVADFRSVADPYYLLSDGSVVEFKLGDAPDETMSQTFPQDVQDALDEAERVNSIKSNGLLLIQDKFPAIDNIDQVKFYAEFYKSIDVTARTPTLEFQYVIDVYQVAVDAIQNGTAFLDVVWPV